MSVVAISLFIIPVIIISYCYSVIIFIIRSRSKKLSSCIGIKAKASGKDVVYKNIDSTFV